MFGIMACQGYHVLLQERSVLRTIHALMVGEKSAQTLPNTKEKIQRDLLSTGLKKKSAARVHCKCTNKCVETKRGCTIVMKACIQHDSDYDYARNME